MYVQNNSEIQDKPRPASIQNGEHQLIVEYGTILYVPIQRSFASKVLANRNNA